MAVLFVLTLSSGVKCLASGFGRCMALASGAAAAVTGSDSAYAAPCLDFESLGGLAE